MDRRANLANETAQELELLLINEILPDTDDVDALSEVGASKIL